jgi:enterochelin esterase family protein
MSPSQVLIHPFESRILENNFLRDPHVRRTGIYLPPDYDATARGDVPKRYPVVYLLAGFTGRGTMMLNESAWEENIQQRLDRLITTDVIEPLIAVLPDAFTRYGGSQYINSAGTGRYMDYLVEELVPWVDAHFRTIAARERRAVAGKSSGGFGALTLAMHHPEIFGAVACHSGDMHFDLCYRPDFPPFLRSIEKFGGVQKFIETFRALHPKKGDFHSILSTVGYASCYSPNTDSPWGFDLPFDAQTGEWHDDVWARWKAWDPIEVIPQYERALRSMQVLYLDCGTRDEFNLQFGARTFCARLQRAGIPYRHEEFDDGHFEIQYRYDVSLKAFSDAWRT